MIKINEHFSKPTNVWSLIGMKDALTQMVGLCSLYSQEAKVEKKEPKQKTKKEDQIASDEIRL